MVNLPFFNIKVPTLVNFLNDFKDNSYILPRFLFAKRFANLSSTSKLVYSVLLSAFCSIMEDEEKKERFRDKKGLFVVFDYDKLASLFFCSRRSILIHLHDLEVAGLIERYFVRKEKKMKIYFNL